MAQWVAIHPILEVCVQETRYEGGGQEETTMVKAEDNRGGAEEKSGRGTQGGLKGISGQGWGIIRLGIVKLSDR